MMAIEDRRIEEYAQKKEALEHLKKEKEADVTPAQRRPVPRRPPEEYDVPLSQQPRAGAQQWGGVAAAHHSPNGGRKRLRTKTEEICRASKLWDGNVCHVQVNEFRERVMEVRILASARNAPRTYDLRCEIREEIITWIQREMPEALPRTRETVSVDGAGVAPQHGIGVVGR